MLSSNLFAEDDPDETAKRIHENSVTMGKMQELRKRMESLSLHKKVLLILCVQ